MKVILYERNYPDTIYWIGINGLRPVKNVTDSSEAWEMNEEEAEEQIDWYDSLGFQVWDKF